MYQFHVGDVHLPLAPEKLSIKIKNKNKTVTLVNEGEINFLRDAGLSDVEFDAWFPLIQHPSPNEPGGGDLSLPLDKFERMKTEKEPFQFVVVRQTPDGKALFNTNMTVSMEDYTIKEQSKEGFYVLITIKLKQYKEYGTKVIKTSSSSGSSMSVTKQRTATNSPAPKKETTYTVKSGDCLWNISKAVYGDGSKYTKIYDANKDKITNPNLIYPNQVLTIPSA